jgi:hypothetical protein
MHVLGRKVVFVPGRLLVSSSLESRAVETGSHRETISYPGILLVIKALFVFKRGHQLLGFG